MRTEEHRRHVMGSSAHVVVVGGRAGAAEAAGQRLADLEARWSRFRPDSELSRLGRSGAPVLASPDTTVLVEALLVAWQRTHGRFDPTMGPRLDDLGRPRRDVDTVQVPLHLPGARPSPGCDGLTVGARGIVTVPSGISLDPGGLGKGLAADIVAGELIAAGAAGALVNVGGDLRVTGRSPRGSAWTVAVEDPARPGTVVAAVELVDGGVATTTSARQHWSVGNGTAHHVLDPRTGLPGGSPDRVQVTVVAGSAWWAEVLATVAFLDGDVIDPHAHGLVVDADGNLDAVGREPARWFRSVEAA